MRLYPTLLFVLAILPISCEDEEITQIDTEIESTINAYNIPSVAAGIVKDGELVWTGAYGFADRASEQPATTNSLYTLQSVSKLVLSVTVMQLWERGLVNLDEDINQYLPYPVRNPHYPAVPITVHMLLNHTSGLAWPADGDGIPAFHNFYFLEDPPEISVWLPEYILPGGSAYRSKVWKDFVPGTRERYSNIGTSLLALIVEEVSGLDYRDYCRVNVFEPLGMENTAFRFDELNQEELVTPYATITRPMQPFSSRHYPVGWIFTDVWDFSRFVGCILNGGEANGERILEATTVREMHQLQNPVTGCANLWWHMMGDAVGHRGGGTGYSSWAEWHMEDDTGFFIFSNTETSQIWPKGRIYELIRYQSNQY